MLPGLQLVGIVLELKWVGDVCFLCRVFIHMHSRTATAEQLNS